MIPYPVTPDGRYFVVRGRLWRCANPALSAEERSWQVHRLMRARRELSRSRKPNADASGDRERRARARRRVDDAKRALGERGPVWWTDGAPDYDRHLVKNTPYAEWYAAVTLAGAGGRRTILRPPAPRAGRPSGRGDAAAP